MKAKISIILLVLLLTSCYSGMVIEEPSYSKFKKQQTVTHVLNNEKLLIIEVSSHYVVVGPHVCKKIFSYECRDSKLNIKTFEEFELK